MVWRNSKSPQLTRATPSAATSSNDGIWGTRVTFTGPVTPVMNRRSASGSHNKIGYTQSAPASRYALGPLERFGHQVDLLRRVGASEEPAQEEIDPCVDHQRVVAGRRRIAHGGEPRGAVAWVADFTGGVVGFLEVAAGRPRVAQRRHQIGRRQAVSGFGVDRHRHVDGARDAPRRGEHLARRGILVVVVAERVGDAGARRGDHGIPGCHDRTGGGDVPGVREQQRVTGCVQRPQLVAVFLQTCHRDLLHVALHGLVGRVVERVTQLPAAADLELPEHLVQVVLHGARADEELRADLRVRVAVARQPRDLELLGRQRIPVVGRDPARGLTGGEELAARPLCEPVGTHVAEALVCDTQLLARVDPTVLAPEPLSVHEPAPRQLDRRRDSA